MDPECLHEKWNPERFKPKRPGPTVKPAAAEYVYKSLVDAVAPGDPSDFESAPKQSGWGLAQPTVEE